MAVLNLTSGISFNDAGIPYFPLGWQALTPSNTDTYNPPLKGVYVGVTGDVSIVSVQNPSVAVVFKNCPQGFVVPASGIIKVNSTSTTATNLVGLI